uniref:Uncharacterized protein n=1 Tax=Arundo donax TaxID=35708 RepID=A0A0A8XS92_ARUDO
MTTGPENSVSQNQHSSFPLYLRKPSAGITQEMFPN